MQYPELATVQARLTYRLASFLLENLAAGHTVEWMDAFHAQRHAAEALGIADRGRPFGHKTWHSGTPNRVDVWECPTNYVKRGTCTTSHLYQEVLLVKMAEALQVLAGRNRAAVDQAVDSLRATGVQRRPSTLHTAIDKLLTESPTQLALHIPDFLAVLEGGCMLTDGRLGFVFITGEAVTLDLPQRWSPVMRPGELAATGRC